MTKDSEGSIKQKIKELDAIYNEFVNKLNELKSERSEIISDITKRVEQKKIQQLLNKLKQ